MNNRTADFINKNNILHSNQCGFRAGFMTLFYITYTDGDVVTCST